VVRRRKVRKNIKHEGHEAHEEERKYFIAVIELDLFLE
jgi:hypothetical protein